MTHGHILFQQDNRFEFDIDVQLLTSRHADILKSEETINMNNLEAFLNS